MRPKVRMHGAPAPRRRGLSLVELMVGITVGLIVVAGASLLAAAQLSDNKRLLIETQVQQDLRAVSDIVARELRRSGYITWYGGTVSSAAGPASGPPANNLSTLAIDVGTEKVSYGYHRPGSGADNTLFFGYRLSGGAIQARIGAGTPQDLTDRNSLEITEFDVDLVPVSTVQLGCTKLCSDGTQNCWPTVTLSDARITISGGPRSDPTLRRTVTSRVRLRNEGVQWGPAATQVCP
jgi:prepilin-type N-terminal cleavage/methylation domain-containing protein